METMNKTVYIIHEVNGIYEEYNEDYYNNVVGVFEDKDVALKYVSNLNSYIENHREDIKIATYIYDGIVKLKNSGLSKEEYETYCNFIAPFYDDWDRHYELRTIKTNEIHKEGDKML